MTYSARMIGKAREHHQAGWTVEEIRGLLAREFGRAPHWATVRCWVDPAYAEKRRANTRKQQRKLNAKRGAKPTRGVSPERSLARMQQLQEAGLSCLAIAQVAAIWWGEVVSEGTVRDRLGGSVRRSYRKRAPA